MLLYVLACFVLCAIRRSKRALFAFWTSSSICSALIALKSEAFVSFNASDASAAATMGAALRQTCLGAVRGLKSSWAEGLRMWQLCEQVREPERGMVATSQDPLAGCKEMDASSL